MSPEPSSASVSSVTGEERSRARRVVLAGGIGTLIEYYDYGLYGFLAVTMAPLFFPSTHPTASLLSALAVFAAAYFFRPIGGIFFGWLGDRSGRKVALAATVISMGVFSSLIGLLPTYQTAGIIAPVLITLCRLASGLSAGGEIGGAATYIAESVPRHRRNFFGAFIPCGANFGFAFAATAVGIVTALTTSAQMSAWGWRIPFLVCIPLTGICLYARLKLEETLEFKSATESGERVRWPALVVLRTHRLAALRVFTLAVATNGTSYIGLTYISIYLTKDVGFSSNHVYWLLAGVIALACLCMPLIGWLADTWGRRNVVLVGLIGYVVLTYPLLTLMDGASTLLLVGGLYLLYMVLNAFVQAPAFAMFPQLFPRAIRYSGVALGFNMGAILAGGTAPYVATLLVSKTGDARSPAFWVMGVAVIGLTSIVRLREETKVATVRQPSSP